MMSAFSYIYSKLSLYALIHIIHLHVNLNFSAPIAMLLIEVVCFSSWIARCPCSVLGKTQTICAKQLNILNKCSFSQEEPPFYTHFRQTSIDTLWHSQDRKEELTRSWIWICQNGLQTLSTIWSDLDLRFVFGHEVSSNLKLSCEFW